MARHLEKYNYAIPNLKKIDKNICEQIEIDCKYEIYVNRQKNDIKNFNREQNTIIPSKLNFRDINGMSMSHWIFF